MNDMTPIRPVGFDYTVLSEELATEARSIAERVRARHQSQIAAIIETGAELTAIKDKLGHGNFEPWIIAEFGWSLRTARNYMQASETFAGKSATVADLTPSALYALAAPSTPEPVRQQVIDRLEAGEKIDPIEVKELVKVAKRKEQIAKLPPRKRKAAEQQQREFERREAAIVARNEAERAAAIQAAQIVEKALGDDLGVFVERLREASVHEFRRYFLG
jgi:hypothetical protein